LYLHRLLFNNTIIIGIFNFLLKNAGDEKGDVQVERRAMVAVLPHFEGIPKLKLLNPASRIRCSAMHDMRGNLTKEVGGVR